MNSLRTTSAVLSGLAVLLFIVVQFTPWGGFRMDGGALGFGDIESDAYTWESKASFGGSSESHSWYDSEADDADGIGQIRAGIPILLAGLVVGLAGMLVTLGVRGALGPILTMVAALLCAVGVILFALGVDSAFDGTDFKWGIAFYLAIVGGALLLVGGIVGLMAGNRSGATA